MSTVFILGVSVASAIFAAAMLCLMIHLTAIRIRSTAKMRCPNCGTRDVRRSHGKGWQDGLYRWFSCSPFRCRSCWLRFYRHIAPPRAAIAQRPAVMVQPQAIMETE